MLFYQVITIGFCFFFSFFSYSYHEIQALKVESYGGVGKGESESFVYQGINYLKEGNEFQVEERSDEIILSFENRELLLDRIPKFFLNSQSYQIDGFHFSAGNRDNFVKTGFIQFQNNRYRTEINDVEINCNGLSSGTSFPDLIQGCLKLADGTGDYIKNEKNKNLSSSPDLLLRDMKLEIKDGGFILKSYFKNGISGNALIKGEASYNKELKRLEVEVRSAKLGIIGIMGILFQLLEGMENEEFVVEKPYLYLYL